jgi:ribosomal protein S18 acetylase RimI-like enzyme
MPVAVRRATARDVETIAAIHVAAWLAAYTLLLPPEVLSSITLESRLVQWTRITGNPVSRTRVWVAEDRGEIAGFASAGPTTDDPSVAELYTLYLAPQQIGQGFGAALLRRATEDLLAEGFLSAVLWVLEGNARARTFYERHGWVEDDRREDEELGLELRYRRALP